MIYRYTGQKQVGKTDDTTCYKLQSPYSNSSGVIMSKSEIKQKLRDGTIEITNMKLTSDGRLIEIKKRTYKNVLYLTAQLIKFIRIGLYNGDNDRDVVFIVDRQAKEIKSKSTLLNIDLNIINEHLFYFRTENKIHICTDCEKFAIINGYGTFEDISCRSINFRNVDTSYLSATNNLFKFAIIKYIDIKNLNMTKIQDASFMFASCRTDEIIISNIKFNYLQHANSVFRYCKADRLIIKNIEAPMLKSIYGLFKFSDIKEIIIENIKIPDNIDKRDMYGYINLENVKIIN